MHPSNEGCNASIFNGLEKSSDHGPIRKLKGHEEELKSMIDAKPDLTPEEIAAKLSIKVCIQTVNVAVQLLGYRHKKIVDRRRAEAA
jgi:hypothetical protein